LPDWAVRFWTAALGCEPRAPEWNPQFMKLVDPSGRRTPVSLQLTDTAQFCVIDHSGD
jgi:hypothetical protein